MSSRGAEMTPSCWHPSGAVWDDTNRVVDPIVTIGYGHTS